MTEETVTKAILKQLINNGWEIVCFDFPQSGTGKMLHPNKVNSEKNKGSIIPDIVAVKDDVCLFFEDKDRFYFTDFEKMNNLITKNDYSDAISTLLTPYTVSKILYGIGLPTVKFNSKANAVANLVDFIVGVNYDMSISLLYPK